MFSLDKEKLTHSQVSCHIYESNLLTISELWKYQNKTKQRKYYKSIRAHKHKVSIPNHCIYILTKKS